MNGNSLGIILLAIGVGLVFGFEIGQHYARKQFSMMIHQVLESAKKQAEEQQKEREKRLEEIQESARKLKEQWSEAWKMLLNPDGRGNVEPVGGDTDGDKIMSVKEYNEQVKKEQDKNGI